MKSTLFFLLVLSSFVFAQTLIDRFYIDDFTVGADVHAVTITLSADVAATDAAVVQRSFFRETGCDGLIGCGRDMQMKVSVGSAGRSCTSNIFTSPANAFGFEAEWDISNPKNFKSVTTLTYDGSVDDSGALNTSGLGGVDFTVGGLGRGLRFSIVSDLNATYTIELYDTNSVVCTGNLAFPAIVGTYNQADTIEDILFTSFSGSCNKASIGAVVLTVPSTDAVDAIVRQVRVVGIEDPSASATPTPSVSPSRGPTQSPSPSPSPSPSAFPSPSPTPSPSTSGPCVSRCTCPAFTCQMMYDADDDVNLIDLNPRTSLFFFDDGDSDVVDSVTPTPIGTVTPTRSIGSTATPTRTPVVQDNGSSSDNNSSSNGAATLVGSVAVVLASALVFA